MNSGSAKRTETAGKIGVNSVYAVTGVTTGTTETTFSPDAVVSRAQVVTFLNRYDGSTASEGSNPFTDVSSDAYYAGAVNWAVANNVTTGTTATTFSPDEDCTRAQIVTFMYRALVD